MKQLRLVLYPALSCLILLTLAASASAKPYADKGRAYYESRGDILWEVPSDEKLVALTFDDGPDPLETPQILDLLKAYEAKATFFVLGNKVKSHPELARREAEEGHEIANHTYTHTWFKGASRERLAREIRLTQEAIFEATGRKPSLFRPPGGVYSENLVHVSKQEGLLMVMWSWHQDTRDWSKPGVNRIVSKVLGNVRNGDIILFHDYVRGSDQTIEALKRILPELKKQGYRLVTVSELMKHRKGLEPVSMAGP